MIRYPVYAPWSHPGLLLIFAVAACLTLTGCGEPEEPIDIDDTSPTVEITDGPEGTLTTTIGDVLTFGFDTTGCSDCELRCGLDDQLDACDGEDEHLVSVRSDHEGDRTFTVEVRDDGDESLADDTRDFEIAFDFDAAIEGLADHTTTSHPYLGDYDVTCDHPNCETSCHWEVDGDREASFDCPTDEPLEMQEAIGQLDEEFGGEASLVLTASSTVADREASFDYLFEFTEPSWQMLDAGAGHTCGILDDGTLWCFGDNSEGQLGIGDDTDAPHIVGLDDELSDLEWEAVSADTYHTCGIAGGEIYCWGRTVDGRLGHPSESTNTTAPVALETDEDRSWDSVSTGDGHTCAITDDDQLFCWGRNNAGQLGIGTTELESTPTPMPVVDIDIDGWQAVSTGTFHTCGIDVDDEVWCWGDADAGRLGIGEPEGFEKSQPMRVSDSASGALTTVSSIATGHEHSCAIAETTHADESSYCWGKNETGQLGTDGSDVSLLPMAVDDSEDFVRVDAGGQQTCGVDDEDDLFCWGWRYEESPVESPERLAQLDDFDIHDVSVGLQHVCAIAEETLFCWGNGEHGQLGQTDPGSTTTPIPVAWPYFATD